MVSVVIATYQKAAALARTLTSLVTQRPPFAVEILVIDDGSTDATGAVCADFPVRYVPLGPSAYRNPAIARNVGLRLARSPILVLQSDEVEHRTPDGLQRLTADIAPGRADFATVYDVDTVGTRLHTYTGPTRRRPYFFLGACHQDDLRAVGGHDEEFVAPGYEDRWLGACLAHHGVRFVFRDDVVGWHYAHPRPATTCSPDSLALYQRKRAAALAGTQSWTAAVGAWGTVTHA